MYDWNSRFDECSGNIVEKSHTILRDDLKAGLELRCAVLRPLNIAPAVELLGIAALEDSLVIRAACGVD